VAEEQITGETELLEPNFDCRMRNVFRLSESKTTDASRLDHSAAKALALHLAICARHSRYGASWRKLYARRRKLEHFMPQIQTLSPEILGKPLGQYSHLTRVKAAEFLFIAGQVGLRPGADKAPAEFDAQCAQAFANIGAALSSQGASFANLVEFTTYLVHSQDIARFYAYRAREFPKLFAGGAYPPNTLLIVDRLVREEFLIEVSAVAAL
jgi:enamine deaminase RidA (YjgF/YER057c/UK114 family)